ncbi:putative ferredoxin-NADP reductase (FNR), nucleotide-binding domain-containing protein [Plasmopara halstedii]
MDNLVVGDSVEILGPQGMLGYPSAGVARASLMLQLNCAIMDESKDIVKFTLVDCNHSLNHIIALTHLEPLANMFNARIKSVQAGQQFDTALLAELLPKVSLKVAVFHCGPPAFNDAV